MLEARQLEGQRQEPGTLGSASIGAIEAGMLRETFPEWCIFSAGGAWWAIRGGLQVWTGPRSLLLRLISATDVTALAERLCLQEWLDGLDDEALTAVYRGSREPATFHVAAAD